VRRVYLLWHDAEPIGICVFGFGPLCSSVRNRLFHLTGRLTRRRAQWINRTLASVVRIVLDPRYRGAGIASAFLRRCCRLVPWPWIELVSEMADLVPFCQAAGFKRIGVSRDKEKRGRSSFSPRSQTSGREAAVGKKELRPLFSRGPYGKSGWTDEGFRAYYKRARFSRPAYYIFDNRENLSR